MLLAAVPDSDPDEARRSGGPESEVQKILVFADENVAFRLRMPEYLSVRGLRQPDIEYVRRVATSGFDEAGQRRRKLIIHRELHEAFRIAWSDWRAAYSIAA